MNRLFTLPKRLRRLTLSELRRRRDEAALMLAESQLAALRANYKDRTVYSLKDTIDRLIQDPFNRNARLNFLRMEDHRLNAADRERLKPELVFLATSEAIWDLEHAALAPRPQQLELV